MQPNRLPSSYYERELNFALALGACSAWSFHAGRRANMRRRWSIALADGTEVIWEAGRVHAFCEGVRRAAEVSS